MNKFYNRHVLLCLLLLMAAFADAQQLKLGANPTSLEKSALLDLNSDKQGLLLPRVNDYAVAPLSTAPDGMLIYYVPEKLLYIRKNGVWKKLVDETTAISSVNGQTGPVVSLTTSDITEGTHLYYTDARARAAFSAGTGIDISGAGVISALYTSNLWNAAQLQGRNIAATAPADQYVLTWDAASSSWMPKTNPATSNWLINGNSGIDANNQFLGTIDDKKMTIKSNNQSFLEFGRRATLNLIDGYTDYTDGDEKVTLLKSALQFDVPATVQFYKPKFWTTTDGNFRLKGSAAGTDFFEMGATGANNNGGFDFIIGDDGDEPISFKSYYYGDATYTEVLRMQRKKVGINVNSTEPAQTLDVRGTMRLTGSTGTPDNIMGRNSTTGDVGNVTTDATTMSMTAGTLKANNTNAVWNANQIQGNPVSTAAPAVGQTLTWNGTAWVPATPASSGATGGVTTKLLALQDADIPSTLYLNDTMYTISLRTTTWQYPSNCTIYLPEAKTCNGRVYIITNQVGQSSGSYGNVEIKPQGSDEIGQGGGSCWLYDRHSVTLQADGKHNYWIIVSKSSTNIYFKTNDQ